MPEIPDLSIILAVLLFVPSLLPVYHLLPYIRYHSLRSPPSSSLSSLDTPPLTDTDYYDTIDKEQRIDCPSTDTGGSTVD
jgi:hypothetical protein